MRPASTDPVADREARHQVQRHPAGNRPVRGEHHDTCGRRHADSACASALLGYSNATRGNVDIALTVDGTRIERAISAQYPRLPPMRTCIWPQVDCPETQQGYISQQTTGAGGWYDPSQRLVAEGTTNTSMTIKDELHQLLDELDEDSAKAALVYMQSRRRRPVPGEAGTEEVTGAEAAEAAVLEAWEDEGGGQARDAVDEGLGEQQQRTTRTGT